jgi:hypothetical protein
MFHYSVNKLSGEMRFVKESDDAGINQAGVVGAAALSGTVTRSVMQKWR